jgi:DNA-binding SARP family transcriptional activator
LFIQAAESLIRLCMQQNRYEEALHWADVLLRHDKCWEQAYQLKMQCYGNLQNIPMVVRTYKKCCTVLQEELCVQQSDKTKELYAQLVSNPLEMQDVGRQG